MKTLRFWLGCFLIARRVYQRLRSHYLRDELLRQLTQALRDAEVSEAEWVNLGRLLDILRKPPE